MAEFGQASQICVRGGPAVVIGLAELGIWCKHVRSAVAPLAFIITVGGWKQFDRVDAEFGDVSMALLGGDELIEVGRREAGVEQRGNIAEGADGALRSSSRTAQPSSGKLIDDSEVVGRKLAWIVVSGCGERASILIAGDEFAVSKQDETQVARRRFPEGAGPS